MDLQKILAEEGPDLIPSLPSELIADVRQMKCLEPYRDELIRGAQVRQNLAILRQRMIGQTVRKLDFVRRKGMRLLAHVDPELFFHHRMVYGPGIWNQKEAVYDTLKRHPEMAVQSENERGRITVGYERPVSTCRAGVSPAMASRRDALQAGAGEAQQISGGRRGARRDAATACFPVSNEGQGYFSAHESPAPGLIGPCRAGVSPAEASQRDALQAGAGNAAASRRDALHIVGPDGRKPEARS